MAEFIKINPADNVAVAINDVEAGCGFDDVMHMIVYLRDIADYAAVREIFDVRFPDIPKVFVWASVCRPGWLVEMECIALKEIQERGCVFLI